jgi:SRSO17 transposase
MTPENVDASGESKTMPLLTLQAISESIAAAGLATAAEVDTAIDSLAAFTASPDTILSSPRVLQVWAPEERRWWSMTPGFPKDGTASPCVARQYSGTLGKTGNCQVGVSVHLVNKHASCAADWRLSCPASWDDKALDDPVKAVRAPRRREQARIPDDIRHSEKWRLALEMIDEMAGPDGWGVLEQLTAAGGTRPVVAADAGYGDNTTFRLELENRG